MAQLLTCENEEEVETYFNEKTEVFINKEFNIKDAKQLIKQRKEFKPERLDLILKEY